jgi:transposase
VGSGFDAVARTVSWGVAGASACSAMTPHIRVRKSNAARLQEMDMYSTIGVDVSKKKFDAALISAQGKYRCKVFSNDPAGFKVFVDWLDTNVPEGRTHARVCLEATGAYHEALANFLFDNQAAVFIVNPLRVKRFIESEGVRNKTDEGDAKALARFATKNELEPWEAPAKSVRELQALVVRLESLQGMRQAEMNRLDVAHPTVRKSIGAVIEALDLAIQDVRSKIRQTIDDDPDLRARKDLLQTIPGLGEATIPPLLAYIGRPERFKTVKSLIAYASLTPAIRQSGTSLDKRKGLHPGGRHELRRALYFPAMVAGKYNPIVAAFWQRLKAQGKPGKVIVVACMHKLLAIAYGVLKSKRPFNASIALTQGA